MSQPQHRYDVYIAATKKGFRDVPYTAVVEWIQQVRLKPEDRIRLGGTSAWRFLRDAEEFAAHFPHAPALQAGDMAEALDSIDLGYESPARPEEEEEDPDMIPLIDISLVLLVFFMMTAAANLVSTAPVETPVAEFANVMPPDRMLIVGLTQVNGDLRYYLGERKVTEEELSSEVSAMVARGGAKEAVVKADARIPFDTVQKLLRLLANAKVERVEAGVREGGQAEAAP
jgi:biopolymer transport protein ExbD